MYLTINMRILFSVNEITSLKSIKHCVNLCELYIRNNKITDIDEIFYLKSLKRLKILWLADNPATISEDYRPTSRQYFNRGSKICLHSAKARKRTV